MSSYRPALAHVIMFSESVLLHIVKYSQKLILVHSILSFQGFLPDSLFHRLLSARPVIPKRVRHRHHHHHAPQSAPLEDPVLGGGEETLVSDGAYMMEDEDLENSPFLTQAFDVKMEGGDSLSQGGYESSDREALLDDVIMAQKDTDSSSSSED